jgi:HAD superfamily phosphoserine phosphatase-like hydrolase
VTVSEWTHPVTTTSPSRAAEFVEAVLRLQPKLAAFDCDGTLWSGDAGEGFFDWELNQGLVTEDIVRWARLRYADYRAGKVSENDMCGEMVAMHRGMFETDLRRAAMEYFDLHVLDHIFPEMRDLVRRLQQSGCDTWVVSSTNHWVIRAAMRHFDIPENRIIAAQVEVEKGRVTDRLLRVPSGEGKPRFIRAMVGRDPDAAFGNSRWDTEMLKMAEHSFAINPNPDLEKVAEERGWTIYFPDGPASKTVAQ